MEYRIRKFIKSDSEEISKFLKRIFLKDNLERVSKKGIEFFINNYSSKNIKQKWSSSYVLVVQDNNKKIIGVGRAKEEGFVTHIFVDKKYRNKGIATTFVKRLESWLKRKGNNKIKLNSSLYAIKFWEKLGYKKIGELKRENGLPMYHMEKILI